MIYWITRTHDEAQHIIKAFQMKRMMNVEHYQVFQSEDMFLTVTGCGAIHSAAAVSRLLTLFPPEPMMQ